MKSLTSLGYVLILSISVIGSIAASSAHAEDHPYTQYWKNHIRTLDVSVYNRLREATPAGAVQEQDGTCHVIHDDDGATVVCSENKTGPTAGSSKSLKFRQLILSSQELGRLRTREARLLSFLQLDQKTTPQELAKTLPEFDYPDLLSVEQMKLGRALAANLELFFIDLLKYYRDARLNEKCQYIQAARTQADFINTPSNDAIFLDDNQQVLKNLYQTLNFRDTAANLLKVCNYREIQSGASYAAGLQDLVNQRMRQRLVGDPDDGFFPKQGRSFQTLLQNLTAQDNVIRGLQTPVDSLFKLKRDFEILNLNFSPVSQDKLAVEQAKTALAKLDVKSPGAFIPAILTDSRRDLQTAENSMLSVENELQTTKTKLVQILGRAPVPNTAHIDALKACDGFQLNDATTTKLPSCLAAIQTGLEDVKKNKQTASTEQIFISQLKSLAEQIFKQPTP